MKWLQILRILGPMVIISVRPELTPIIGDIINAIAEAEAMVGANGNQKLVHVIRIADHAVAAANKAGHHIDPISAHTAVTEVVQAIIAVANLLGRDLFKTDPAA